MWGPLRPPPPLCSPDTIYRYYPGSSTSRSRRGQSSFKRMGEGVRKAWGPPSWRGESAWEMPAELCSPSPATEPSQNSVPPGKHPAEEEDRPKPREPVIVRWWHRLCRLTSGGRHLWGDVGAEYSRRWGSHVSFWRKSIPGRGPFWSQCRGPEAGAWWACSNSRRPVRLERREGCERRPVPAGVGGHSEDFGFYLLKRAG